MVLVLVGVRGCVLRSRGIAWLYCFSLSVSVKDRAVAMDASQVTDLLSRAHTWVWALGRLVTLLSWVPALSRPTIMVVFGLGGPCTALSPGLRGRGLESQFGQGPGHPRQESDGLVLLVPGVQAGRVFSGYPAGGH